MEVSIVIVTKNRAEALAFTLNKLLPLINLNQTEVMVFIDGCIETEKIKSKFTWVKWYSSSKSIGASPARNSLYKHATGNIFIGLDDDAHPISVNFIEETIDFFQQNKNLGIIAFQEIKGVFSSDSEALQQAEKEQITYQTNDFIGCGFAISKLAYQSTNGFPLWMTIYGEESCVAYEVMQNNFEIYYHNQIIVNHRVDKAARILQNKNYFRFENQLLNTANFFVVYHKNPVVLIAKLFFHNFKKYAIKNTTYFKLYLKVLFLFAYKLFRVLKHRKPINKASLLKIKNLQHLKY